MNEPRKIPTSRLFRLLSTGVGLGAILVCAAMIAVRRPPLPSALDGVLGLNLLAMIFVRGLDVPRFDGRSAPDEPTTFVRWGRYVTLLLAVTLAAWLLAHLIAGSFA